jgi:hypothetical protein
MKCFYHNQYGDVPFDMGYCIWNNEKYVIPVTNKHDINGLAFAYKVYAGGQICEPYVHNRNDYWSSRKGKRCAKYISYRKSRNEKK